MKVAKLYSFKDIRIDDMPMPKIGRGDALVRVKVCGICSGDVMPWYIEKKAPLVLGHEAVGEIVALGKEVRGEDKNVVTRRFKVGDRVFFHHHAPCFKCRYCRNGDYVQCGTWRKSKIIPGGISEYALIPEVNLKGDTLLLPDKISFEQAALIEPVACVVKGLKRVKIRQGDTVLVIGLGVMGQLHVMLAKKYGASMVIGADRVPYRLKKAKDFGADKVIDVSRDKLIAGVCRATKGNMADVAVVGPGDVRAMSLGISCAGRGGRVLLFTPTKPDDVLKLKPNDIYFNDINIITSYSCGPDDTREALNLISEGAVDNRLITHRFPMAKAPEAFKLTAKAKNSLKAIVIV
jgi:L-iditol 2-dehydrogenase